MGKRENFLSSQEKIPTQQCRISLPPPTRELPWHRNEGTFPEQFYLHKKIQAKLVTQAGDQNQKKADTSQAIFSLPVFTQPTCPPVEATRLVSET